MKILGIIPKRKKIRVFTRILQKGQILTRVNRGKILTEGDRVKKMIEYRVNKNKGVVCAFMVGCNQDFVNYVYNCTAVHRNGNCNFAAELINQKYLNEFPDRFFATAKCNEETGDEWNEEFGKEVAKAKLLSKYYTVRARFIKDIFSDISEMITGTNGVLDKLNEGFFMATTKMSMNNDIVFAVNQGYNPTDPDDDISKYVGDDEPLNEEEWADILEDAGQ